MPLSIGSSPFYYRVVPDFPEMEMSLAEAICMTGNWFMPYVLHRPDA
jgi:hypothetical protein